MDVGLERESRGFNGIEREIYCCIMGVIGVVMKVGFKLNANSKFEF